MKLGSTYLSVVLFFVLLAHALYKSDEIMRSELVLKITVLLIV
jgi:hypothetical protein